MSAPRLPQAVQIKRGSRSDRATLVIARQTFVKIGQRLRRAFWRLDTAAASCIESANWREGGTMRGLLWCGLFCVLIGCAEYKAQLAAEDDAKCQSYGAKRGEPAYVQCRAQLDAARTQADAAVASAVIQAPKPIPPPQPPPPLRW
jgi:hypothetical protein